MKSFLATLLLLVPAIGYGAEANVKSEFTIKAPYEKTINFIDRNQKQLRDAAGLEVLEDLGNGELKVRRDTPKGVFVWIMKEEIEEKDGIYKAK